MATINNIYEILDQDNSQLLNINKIDDNLSNNNNNLNIWLTKHINNLEYLNAFSK